MKCPCILILILIASILTLAASGGGTNTDEDLGKIAILEAVGEGNFAFTQQSCDA